MARPPKPRPAQSATSLPRAPLDDAQLRMRKYAIMMSTRVACFILMVVVTPYSWYTWVFALGAAVLPYLAVVVANVGVSGPTSAAVDPVRSLETGTAPEAPAPAPTVIRLEENPGRDAE